MPAQGGAPVPARWGVKFYARENGADSWDGADLKRPLDKMSNGLFLLLRYYICETIFEHDG